MSAAHNSKTINEIKLGPVIENHKLINLVLFNCHMTSSLHHNDVKTQNLKRILQKSS